jgi:hypothetical protein
MQRNKITSRKTFWKVKRRKEEKGEKWGVINIGSTE